MQAEHDWRGTSRRLLHRGFMLLHCNRRGKRATDAAVSLYGAERIVCGTDGTEFGCDWTRKVLAEAQIGEDARGQILHRNAAAMLASVVKPAQRGRVAA